MTFILRKLAFDRSIAFDPPKSPAQKRLMEAAAHNSGGYGGVSQKVGKEFVGDEADLATTPNAAGIQFLDPNGRALFLKRSNKSNDHAGTWCWPGGGIEGDETPEQAAARETTEETGYTPQEGFQALDQQTDGEVSFKTFGQDVDQAFVPALDEEHVGYAWAPLNHPPMPLHPGVAKTIERQLAKGGAEDADPPGVKHDPGSGRFTSGSGSEAHHETPEGARTYPPMDLKHEPHHVTGQMWRRMMEAKPHSEFGNRVAKMELPKGGLLNFHEINVQSNSRGKARGGHRRGEITHVKAGEQYGKAASEKKVHEILKEHGYGSKHQTANDSYAFDRATVRKIDPDNGHMHVATTNISKANVCPYLGSEIPDWQALGLDPEKIYNLYRDPEELAKAAPSFNNLPLLRRHVENTAEDHNTNDVIGSTGTDAEFKHPYLQNSLVVWDQPYIDAIENESQKELSSAYRYRADMSPGTSPQGEKFDGVMRDIKGNHVALVKEGRAGSDVVVGDSKEVLNMKHALSLKAVMARGALAAFLAPKLAKDTAIPLSTILGGVTAKNFAEKKPIMLKALTDAVKGKLAKDEKADGLAALLDALESTPVVDDADPMEDATFNQDDLNSGANPEDDGHDDPAKGEDDPMDAVKKFLAGKLSPEDMAQIEKLCGGESAMDDPPPFTGMPKSGSGPVGTKKSGEEGAKDKDMVSKEDMDKAVKGATDAAIKVQSEIRAAEKLISPYVGELSKSYSSASETIKHALMAMDVKGVEKIDDVNALTIILGQQKKRGEKEATKVSELAMDAKGASSFAERHPGASRIQIA